jgi:hypothetical protein
MERMNFLIVKLTERKLAEMTAVVASLGASLATGRIKNA